MKGYHHFKGYSVKIDYDEMTGKFVARTVNMPGFGETTQRVIASASVETHSGGKSRARALEEGCSSLEDPTE